MGDDEGRLGLFCGCVRVLWDLLVVRVRTAGFEGDIFCPYNLYAWEIFARARESALVFFHCRVTTEQFPLRFSECGACFDHVDYVDARGHGLEI